MKNKEPKFSSGKLSKLEVRGDFSRWYLSDLPVEFTPSKIKFHEKDNDGTTHFI